MLRLLGTALGADVSYLHVVLTDSSPHVSNLGCTRPWGEAGELFLGIALGISAWDPMDKPCLGGTGAGLPWHTHLHEGESAFWSPSFLHLTGWSRRFPGPGGRDGHRQGRLASNSTLPGEHGTLALIPSPSSAGSIPPCPEPGATVQIKMMGLGFFPSSPLTPSLSPEVYST